MAIRVRLTNKSQPTKQSAESSSTDSSILLSRSLYQRLGSLILNRNISLDYNNKTIPGEFVEMLDAFDTITQNQKFPNLPQTPVDEHWLKLDEYLGDLGVTESYAYSKDTRDIPAWLDTEFRPDYRILVDVLDNTYLTDSNGDEILVIYKGV